MNFEDAITRASGRDINPDSAGTGEEASFAEIKPFYNFGKFQKLAAVIMILGINSGNLIIYPLAYLELMP